MRYLFLLVLLAGCGREGAVPQAEARSQAPGYSRYPYFFTLICDEKLTTLTIKSPSDEPVKCPINSHKQ